MRLETGINIEEYKRLRAEGYTKKFIAKVFGISLTVLNKKLKRRGID